MTKMPRDAERERKLRVPEILETLHKKAVENRENPTMGFREIRKTTRMGTNSLYKWLDELVDAGHVATTTIGAYKRYYITPQGTDHQKSQSQMEQILAAKPKIMRLESENPQDPTATVYYKNISFSDLESVVRPTWEKFVKEIRTELKDRKCEIGFVGTVKPPQ